MRGEDRGSWHPRDNRGYILSSPEALGLVVSQESLLPSSDHSQDLDSKILLDSIMYVLVEYLIATRSLSGGKEEEV